MWIRRCPSCGKTLGYSTNSNWNYAKKQNSRCGSCARSGEAHPQFGTKHTTERREKITATKRVRGMPAPNLGREFSSEWKRNLRLSAIRKRETRLGQVSPGYNPDACRLIEAYGQQHGFKFQHAENGGEFYIKQLGYWVDGYDKDRNVVIEVYEPWHRRQIDRDQRRQKEIERHLGCKFIVLEQVNAR